MPLFCGEKIRWRIVFLCVLINAICYADRTNIGIAIQGFVEDKRIRGQVFSSFFYGYISMQLLSGWLATRIGAKKVLIAGVIVWTTFDISTIYASSSYRWLVVVRILMGCGEAVTFPCLHRLAAMWFPVKERSILVSLVSGGSDLGTIVALLVSPTLMAHFGWQSIFLVFGIFSGLWIIMFSLFGASFPSDSTHITKQELLHIESTRGSSQETYSSPTPWSTIFTHPAAWAIYNTHFCFNYGWYVLLGWLPQYFEEKMHIRLADNPIFAALPYLCGYIGLLLAGWISNHLIRLNVRVLHVRKLMNTVSTLGPGICLFMLGYAKNAYQASALLGCALFLGRMSASGYWVNMIDIAPSYASEVMGISNTIATIPGIVGNIITGYILHQTNNWNTVFNVAAGVLVFGSIPFLLFARDSSILDKNLKYQPLRNQFI